MFCIYWFLIKLQNIELSRGLIIGARGGIVIGCIFLFTGRWSITEGGGLITEGGRASN